MGVLARLGASSGAVVRFWWILLGDIGAKMGATWAKLAASCGQDGPEWRQDDVVGLSWGAFAGVLGAFLVSCFTFCGKMAEVQKRPNLSDTFECFLAVLASSGGSCRLSWERSGGYVGRCWLQDGVVLAISGDVWTS